MQRKLYRRTPNTNTLHGVRWVMKRRSGIVVAAASFKRTNILWAKFVAKETTTLPCRVLCETERRRPV